MRLEGKFNCPIFACNKRSDDLANLMQHIRNGHNNKLSSRYLIVDRSEGRVWMENRLPSKLQENAKEQLERKEIGYSAINNTEQLQEAAKRKALEIAA